MGHVIWGKEMGMDLEGVSWGLEWVNMIKMYELYELYELLKVLLKYF